MARTKRDNIVVGLDIGTTKICAIVGEIKGERVDVVGMGSAPSKGLRKGVVINIEATVNSIKRAVEDAERSSGIAIESVYAGIAGNHIRSFNSHGIVAINREVSQADVERVLEAAKAVAIPVDRELIHILPQHYIIDEQSGIKDPLGMAGVRLEARVHIVTGAVTSAQNIIKCAKHCNLEVADIVLEQLASANAVLSEDEKDMGVAIVDIGGGTTDIAIFSKGSILHTSVVPIGGNHLTNDIAIGLRTPQESAEEIKKRYGSASKHMMGQDEVIEVPSIGDRPDRILRRQILGDIIEPRVMEIFELVAKELEKVRSTELLASGVVLTGGSALLPGIVEIAEEIIGLPVRLGLPQGVGGIVDVVKSPIHATGVGLVLYGAAHMRSLHKRFQAENIYTKVKKRMGSWLQDMI